MSEYNGWSKMKRTPSKKILQSTFGKEKGSILRGLLDGSIDPESFASVQEWMRRSHYPPHKTETILEACNEVLEGYGVEAIRNEGSHVDNYHFDIVASYVNMGDTYVGTILADHTRNDTFYCTTWDDWIELFERRH